MSWYVGDELDTSKPIDLSGLRDKALAQNSECGYQFEIAAKVISDIISSGSVGEPRSKFLITMGGYSNPTHEPQKAWANNVVHVCVEQAR